MTISQLIRQLQIYESQGKGDLQVIINVPEDLSESYESTVEDIKEFTWMFPAHNQKDGKVKLLRAFKIVQ